jgi:hypothetical protein
VRNDKAPRQQQVADPARLYDYPKPHIFTELTKKAPDPLSLFLSKNPTGSAGTVEIGGHAQDSKELS